MSQETDADDPAVYLNAVRKLDELPAYLKKLQRRVFEAETARKAAELKLREYEERIRALQIENGHFKARQSFSFAGGSTDTVTTESNGFLSLP